MAVTETSLAPLVSLSFLLFPQNFPPVPLPACAAAVSCTRSHACRRHTRRQLLPPAAETCCQAAAGGASLLTAAPCGRPADASPSGCIPPTLHLPRSHLSCLKYSLHPLHHHLSIDTPGISTGICCYQPSRGDLRKKKQHVFKHGRFFG